MCINWRKAQNVYMYSQTRLTSYRLTLLRTYVVCLQTQYIKPSSQIRSTMLKNSSICINIKLPNKPHYHISSKFHSSSGDETFVWT